MSIIDKILSVTDFGADNVENVEGVSEQEKKVKMYVENSEIFTKTIGLGLTGSFCTMNSVLTEIAKIKSAYNLKIQPIMSENVDHMDTKFGTAEGWKNKLAEMECEPTIKTIVAAEPIGPTASLDLMIIAPCTGNTLAKLALGITDGAVLMAAKAHLRNRKPLVIAFASNDALGINAKNFGILLAMENVYFVPLGQDSPDKKPNSLVFKVEKIADTMESAMKNKQIQPLFLEY